MRNDEGPGKSDREGVALIQMMDMFPTDESATKWFESVVWPEGPEYHLWLKSRQALYGMENLIGAPDYNQNSRVATEDS